MRLAMLDMGKDMYGDCLFLDIDGFTVLIDGGHAGDIDAGGADIPGQLKRLTKKAKQKVDLLIVTHSHADHLGCLPEMVENGILTAKYALVSDPDHRYGKTTERDSIDGLGAAGERVLDLMGEELPENPNREELDSMLDKLLPVASRYRAMIDRLRSDGTTVVRYQTDALSSIGGVLEDHGIEVLGPTRSHILLCAKRLTEERKDTADRIRDVLSTDSRLSVAELYMRVLGPEGLDSLDSKKNKGAVNNLSIVISVTVGNNKLLLPGDMQFAKAETDGLDETMTKLLEKVAKAGPYSVVKTPHHLSYNGWNEVIHTNLLSAPYLLHSGGWDDGAHPEAKVLKMMEQFAEGHAFLRTDRNGLVQMTVTDDNISVKYDDGDVNDFTPNPGKDSSKEEKPLVVTSETGKATSSPAVQRKSDDVVRVIAEIPHTSTKVIISIGIEPASMGSYGRPENQGGGSASRAGNSASPARPNSDLNGLDGLANLLVLTNNERLAAKVGGDTLSNLQDAAETYGAGWVGDIPASFDLPAIQSSITRELARGYKGVLLLGDYDVIPPARFDCLPDDVRTGLSPNSDDPDNYLVWSDHPYGDRDGDGIQEVPVSRAPDGGSSGFLLSCLRRRFNAAGSRLMVRNVNRPFAEEVALLMPGAESSILESQPKGYNEFSALSMSSACIYLMLHGSDFDGTRFWGEEEDGYLEAVNVPALSDLSNSIVFAGCCWGGLVGREPAYRVLTDQPPISRRPQDSLAMSCLAKGAAAFVGCTGAHYSPLNPPYGYYGHPMHNAFWTAVAAGAAPAQALFQARLEYLRGVPHPSNTGSPAMDELAIELKIYHQFTCLGLGW